jgi:hypothetical protein
MKAIAMGDTTLFDLHRYPSTPVTGQVAIYRRSNNDATPALVIPDLASSDSWFGSAIGR